MAFTVLAADTTISVAEVNDNFTHIGQGDLCPRTGTTLTLDDSVTSNLGSDDYRWKTIYATNLNITGNIDGAWTRIAGVVATTTATSLEFTGLNGDSTGVYLIKMNIFYDPTTASYVYCHLNNDSASNYGYQRMTQFGVGWYQARDSATGFRWAYMWKATTTTRVEIIEMLLYAKTGAPRLLLQNGLWNLSEKYFYGIDYSGQSWNNTANTLTSIKFISLTHKIRTGTTIDIYSLARL